MAEAVALLGIHAGLERVNVRAVDEADEPIPTDLWDAKCCQCGAVQMHMAPEGTPPEELECLFCNSAQMDVEIVDDEEEAPADATPYDPRLN